MPFSLARVFGNSHNPKLSTFFTEKCISQFPKCHCACEVSTPHAKQHPDNTAIHMPAIKNHPGIPSSALSMRQSRIFKCSLHHSSVTPLAKPRSTDPPPSCLFRHKMVVFCHQTSILSSQTPESPHSLSSISARFSSTCFSFSSAIFLRARSLRYSPY